MKKNLIAFTAEFSDEMVSTYETWAEPLSARLAKVALGRTTVSAGDRMLDIGAGTGALTPFRPLPSGRELLPSTLRPIWSID